MKPRTMVTASLIAAMALLGGCALSPSYDDPYYVETVRVAPPPPYVEYVGTPPMVGQVWISGYWNWGGARYVWVPGRWEAPRPGHYWVPHRWDRDGDRWRRHGGRWETHGHRGPPPTEFRDPPRIERHAVPRSVPGHVAPPERPEGRHWRQGDRPGGDVLRDERHFGHRPERRDPPSGSPNVPPRLDVPRPAVVVPERNDTRREAPPAPMRPRAPMSDERGWQHERIDRGAEGRGRNEGR